MCEMDRCGSVEVQNCGKAGSRHSGSTKEFLLLNKCWFRKENCGIVLRQFVARGDTNNGSFSEQKAG
jgi:hypothetical protein